MTIIVAGYMDFAPGLATQIILDAQPMIDAGKAEQGCVAYDWTVDPAKPDRVHVYEEWVDEAALANHFAQEPYAQMGAHLNKGEGIVNFSVQKYRFDIAEPVYDDEGKPRADFFTAK